MNICSAREYVWPVVASKEDRLGRKRFLMVPVSACQIVPAKKLKVLVRYDPVEEYSLRLPNNEHIWTLVKQNSKISPLKSRRHDDGNIPIFVTEITEKSSKIAGRHCLGMRQWKHQILLYRPIKVTHWGWKRVKSLGELLKLKYRVALQILFGCVRMFVKMDTFACN